MQTAVKAKGNEKKCILENLMHEMIMVYKLAKYWFFTRRTLHMKYSVHKSGNLVLRHLFMEYTKSKSVLII